MRKLNFKSDIFKFFHKSGFFTVFHIFLFFLSYIYIKMAKSLSAKYYQENEERIQKS